MKISFLLVLCLSLPAFAETISEFRWKKRLLVITEGNKQLATALIDSKAGLAERDLEVFVLSGPVGCGRVPTTPLGNELRKRLGVQNDHPEVILLGKDGHTILRWKVAKFTMANLFGSVDAMPMRKQEMNLKR